MSACHGATLIASCVAGGEHHPVDSGTSSRDGREGEERRSFVGGREEWGAMEECMLVCMVVCMHAHTRSLAVLLPCPVSSRPERRLTAFDRQAPTGNRCWRRASSSLRQRVWHGSRRWRSRLVGVEEEGAGREEREGEGERDACHGVVQCGVVAWCGVCLFDGGSYRGAWIGRPTKPPHPKPPFCCSVAGVFLGLVSPYLGRHISWAVPAVSGVLVGIVACTMAATALRDPGFYPRSPQSADAEYG